MTRSFYQRGTSMVENAIVLGLLLVLVFAIIDFGRALYTYHLVDNAARLGARFAMVRGARCNHTAAGSDPWPCPIVPPDMSGEIQTYVQQQSILIGLGNVTVVPSWSGEDANGNPYPGCQQDGVYDQPGCPVTVTVTYNFQFLAPFVSTARLAMKSTSQMVISQ
jgi:Flp pilus assembly protein TadG